MSDKINNVHDKFFRASMGHQSVAIDFIQHHFPKKISQALNTNSLKLLQQSFIKQDLQEHFSDLVFSCELADKPAYLTLLIEHQSSPDKMMAFRIHQYLFGLLSNYRKQHPNKLLPAVYSLVFYHGKTTPYPYSLSLQSCFDDPLNIMSEVLYKDIALVDVNQLPDEVLKKQEWIGPVTSALKYIRQQEMAPFALGILSSLHWPMDKYEAKEMLHLLLNYLLSAGNIEDIDSFMTSSIEQLSSPIRSEMMTFAEKMEERGIEKGKQEGILEGKQEGMLEGETRGKQDVALRMLNEGVELAFISKVTDFSLAELKRLQEKT
jgi:predicted transposase/invertase (TIGR01784 family)